MNRCLPSLLLTFLLVTGCTTTLIDYSYDAADQLVAKLEGNANQLRRPLRQDRPIIVTTFMDMNNLETTTPIGRVLAEQVASRFSEQGYAMIELKLLSRIYMVKGVGEYVLSRELSQASREYDAQAIIVGTYVLIKDQLYVNVKIVDAAGNVYSSHDFNVPKSKFQEKRGH